MNEIGKLLASGQQAYEAALQEGIRIGKRESAAKLAEKDAAIADLVALLQRIAAGTVPAVGASTSYTDCMAFAQAALAKHAPILPNLHSHHDRAELLRDEYPDKYAGLKADAIRENGDTK